MNSKPVCTGIADGEGTKNKRKFWKEGGREKLEEEIGNPKSMEGERDYGVKKKSKKKENLKEVKSMD